MDTIITIILFFPGTQYREIWCSLKLNTLFYIDIAKIVTRINYPLYSISINKLTLDTENYLSVWCQTHYDFTDKNNKVCFEGLEKYYHCLSACTIGLTVILVVMSVSTFKTAIILYLLHRCPWNIKIPMWKKYGYWNKLFICLLDVAVPTLS